jgi:hypothetical protein
MSRPIPISGEYLARFREPYLWGNLAYIDSHRDYAFVVQAYGEVLLIVDNWSLGFVDAAGSFVFTMLSTGLSSANIIKYIAEAKWMFSHPNDKRPSYLEIYKEGMVIQPNMIYVIVPIPARSYFSTQIQYETYISKGLISVHLGSASMGLTTMSTTMHPKMYKHLMELYYEDVRKQLGETAIAARYSIPIEATLGIEYYLEQLLEKPLETSEQRSRLPVIPYTPHQ